MEIQIKTNEIPHDTNQNGKDKPITHVGKDGEDRTPDTALENVKLYNFFGKQSDGSQNANHCTTHHAQEK